jgi:peptide/nickel transport system ATP-binding protein
LIEARALTREFVLRRSWVPGSGQMLRAVDRVDLAVQRGETLGLVGESGSGKSTLGRCLTRLIETTDGSVVFDGQDVTRLGARRLRPFRRSVQMIFQDPSSSLNPRRRVGDILSEPLAVHGIRPAREIPQRLRELVDLVGLPAAALDRFPHEFSGGQRQRIGIARALAMEPRLIVADEPVSALDVSVQAQVVNLFADLRERLSLTYLFIAHDLGVVRQVSTRVAIMYLGSIVETGVTDTVFDAPAHPYTEALLSAIPVPVADPAARRRRIILKGEIPNAANPPKGCKFVTRCPYAQDVCHAQRPSLRPLADGRLVACHFPRTAQPAHGAAAV